MTRSLSHHDERLVHRFLDGELSAGEAAEFARRLADEPALQQFHRQLEGLRVGFAADRRSIERQCGTHAPAGLAARVLATARQLPQDGKWRRDIADERVMLRWCRRLMLAAAVVLGLAAAWHGGLFDRRQEALQASPAEMEREMERLDRLIREGVPATAAPTTTPQQGK